MIEIVALNDPRMTDSHWQALQSLLDNLRLRFDSFYPEISWRKIKEQKLSLLKTDPHQHIYVAVNGDNVVGYITSGGRNIGQPDQSLYLYMDADFENVPREYSLAVAAEMVRLLENYGISEIEYVSNSKRMSQPVDRWHGTQLNILNRYRLIRKAANNGVIERWLENIPERNGDMRLEFYEIMPENYLEQYAELYSRLLSEMPQEGDGNKEYHVTAEEIRMYEEWRRKNHRHQYYFLLHDRGDNIAGFSNANIDDLDPTEVYQSLTGVIGGYRGRGLSKWLKAALFEKIGEDFPDNKVMITDMRAVNEPIQKVNAQMGYELVGEGGEFRVTLENLRAALSDGG